MSVLTLDLATNVGWASFYDGGKRFKSGEFRLQQPTVKKVKSPRAVRYTDLDTQLRALSMRDPDGPMDAPDDPITVLVVERHRGAMKTVETAEVLYGYLAIAEQWAARNGIQIARINASANKKHATGVGNASKKMMMQAARRLFRGVKLAGDDEADALHLGRAYFDGVIEK